MNRTKLCVAILMSVVLVNVSAAQDATFQWHEHADGELDLMYGDAPVLRYMHAYDDSSAESLHDTYKVFHHVFGPQSGQMITKGPGGKYTHHRGLYVGWNKTQTPDGMFDFWHCKDGAHLRHVKILSQQAGERHGSMVTEIHWNDADGKPVIVEQRQIRVSVDQISNGRAWIIDWSTILHSKRGGIQLSGDRQHAGFQFRAAQPVADADSARYIRPEGFPEQTEAFQVGDKGDPPAHINLHWLSMDYPLDDFHYNVEYFQAPGQPAPSLFSERPYGRFGAFYKADVSESAPLNMAYRVIVSEGKTSARNEIQTRYDAYVSSLKVE